MTPDELNAWREERQETLEIENPSVQCGHCGFGAELVGVWTVEDGRLVFRADANPLRGCGPDFHSCGESSPVIDFTRITADGVALTEDQVAVLQATAQAADEAS